jgi:DNA-binding transcriptional LysR family regulator
MQNVNIAALNVSLLRVLQALLEEKHVTRAAHRLNLSQSKVSRDLKKLREIFNDPLLARTQSGYILTAGAERITGNLNCVIDNIESMLTDKQFDPALCKQTIRIYAGPLEVQHFMPMLFKKLHQQAPNLRLEVLGESENPFDLLASGQIHFVMSGLMPDRGLDQFYMKPLSKGSQMVCLMRCSNPLAEQALTLERYLASNHGYTALTGKGTTFIDRSLQRLDRSRHVTAVLPSFEVAANFCEQSDLIVAMPEAIAQQLIQGRALTYKNLPEEIQLPEVEHRLYWHAHCHHDPACSWVRGLVETSVR